MLRRDFNLSFAFFLYHNSFIKTSLIGERTIARPYATVMQASEDLRTDNNRAHNAIVCFKNTQNIITGIENLLPRPEQNSEFARETLVFNT